MSAETPCYKAVALGVQLDRTQILKSLDFEIARGEWVGLLGPNGSGKTTLLRTLGGLLPYSGSLSLDGRALETYPEKERAREVAFVRQFAALSFDFTIRDVVELGLAPHLGWLDKPSRKQHEQVDAALHETDLQSLSGRTVSTLSGGEQQRVLLAQALAQSANILLLDEPTAHLDVHHQYDLMERITGQSGSGKTIIAAFHDLAFAARYADRLLVLNYGRLVANGPPRDVLTSDLIRSVFRMEAEVEATSSGLEVRYLSPI